MLAPALCIRASAAATGASGADDVFELEEEAGAVLSYKVSDVAASLALALDLAAAIAASPADAPRPIADGSRASPEARDLTDIPLARLDGAVGDVDSDFAIGGSSGGGGGGGAERTLGSKIFEADFCLGFASSSSSSLGQSSLDLRLGFLLLKDGDENTDTVGADTD